MSGYLKHIQLSKQLEDKAREAAKNRQLAEEQIEMAANLIAGAKRVDADIAKGEGLVAEANAGVAAKDYRLALEKATLAVMELRNAYRSRAEAIIEESGKLIASAAKVGLDLGESKEALEASRAELQKGNTDGAVEQARRAWKRGETTINQHLSTSFSKAQSLILVNRGMGKDVSGAEDLLSRARSSLEAHDFEQALAFMGECLEGLSGELDAEVKARRMEVTDLLANMDALKLEGSRVKTLLERAEGDLASGSYDKALASFKQAKAEAEKVLQRGLEGSTGGLEATVREAEAMGADTARVRQLMQRAQEAAKRGNFSESLKAMGDFRQALEESKFQRVLNTISQSRSKFITARTLGANMSVAVDYLNRAREALQKGSFSEALQCALKGDEELDALVNLFQTVDREMKALEAEIGQAETAGVDMGTARGLLEKARAGAQAQNRPAYQEQLRRAQEEVERARSEKAAEVADEAQFLLSLGRRMGLTMAEEHEGLEACQRQLEAKDFAGALAQAGRSKALAETRLTQYINKRMENARAAFRAGTDVTKVNGLLAKAATALGVKDFENALALTDQALLEVSAELKESGTEILRGLRGGAELVGAFNLNAPGVAEAAKAVEVATAEARFADVPSMADQAMGVLRGLAEQLFEGVKGEVVQIKNLNGDIEAMKEFLRASKASLQAGELAKGLAPLAECHAQALKALALHQEAQNAMATAAVQAAEAKKKGIDVTAVVNALVEARRALDAGQASSALEMAKSAAAEVDRLVNLTQVQGRLMEAREKVELAIHLGIEVERWRQALEDAKAIIKAHDFEAGLRAANMVQDEVLKLIRDKVSTEVSRAGTVAGELRGLGFNTGAFDERVGRARDAQGKGEVRQAAELARAVTAEMEALRSRHVAAEGALKRVRATMADLEAVGADPSVAEKPLRKAEKAFTDGRFEEASRLAEDALQTLEDARGEGISRSIASFERMVSKARGEGVSTKSAEQILRRARELLAQRQFKESLSVAMQSEGELERVELQKDIAQKALASAKKKLQGLAVLPAEVKAMMGEADQAFGGGDYVKVLHIALATGEEVSRAADVYTELKGLVEETERVRVLAEAIGADVAKITEMLEEAKVYMDHGSLDDARAALERTREWGLGSSSSRLSQMISDLRGYLVLCSLINADPGNAEEKLSSARAHVESGDLENARLIIEEAREACEGALKGRVNDTLGGSKAAIAYAKKMGADTGQAEALLAEAEEALASKKFDRAVMLAQKATDAVEANQEAEKTFVETTYQADSLIKSAKKFGIEVREAERDLARSLELKRNDPEGAIGAATDALNLAREALEGFSPNLDAVLEVKDPTPGSWVEAGMILRNDGKALAKDITLQVLGDVEVEGLRELPILRGQGSERMSLRVRFPNPGRIPLILKVSAVRVLDGKTYESEKIQEVEVGGGAPEPKVAKKVIAEFDTRCLICRGTIKKGFAATLCSCSSMYHDMCARRSGRCAVCGNPLG